MSCWIGKENLKTQLIEAAKMLKVTEEPLKGVDDRTWFTNVVRGHRGMDYNPLFKDKVEANLEYRRLVREAVKVYGIHINEVRLVTIPEFNSHPNELARLEAMARKTRK